MRFLIIDAEGAGLKERAGVRVELFTSNPDLDVDADPAGARPNTHDVEEAISRLVGRDSLKAWDGAREFIVVPLEASYKVNVRHRAMVEVQSTGGMA